MRLSKQSSGAFKVSVFLEKPAAPVGEQERLRFVIILHTHFIIPGDDAAKYKKPLVVYHIIHIMTFDRKSSPNHSVL